MRYVSIDLETLGLNPQNCDIIEFGAVIDDLKTPVDQLPHYHCYVLPLSSGYPYQGEPFAMAMHSEKLRRIAARDPAYEYVSASVLEYRFKAFLVENGYAEDIMGYVDVVAAGKNFGSFDLAFLRKLTGFEDSIKFYHAHLDPGSMYFDPATDERPPSLQTCLRRAGIDRVVQHDAVSDAIDVICCIRKKHGIPC